MAVQISLLYDSYRWAQRLQLLLSCIISYPIVSQILQDEQHPVAEMQLEGLARCISSALLVLCLCKSVEVSTD